MSWYPRSPSAGQRLQTDVDGTFLYEGVIAHYQVGTAAASATSDTAVHAAIQDNAGTQTVTTAITSPLAPRNIIAVAGGTAADIKAISPVIHGTDFNGAVISETLPAFTVNTAGTVEGSKAFASVGTIVLPPHDGTLATTSFGWGDKLGIPDMLSRNTVILATLDGVYETTRPTVAFSGSVLASNTVDLNSALNCIVCRYCESSHAGLDYSGCAHAPARTNR